MVYSDIFSFFNFFFSELLHTSLQFESFSDCSIESLPTRLWFFSGPFFLRGPPLFSLPFFALSPPPRFLRSFYCFFVSDISLELFGDFPLFASKFFLPPPASIFFSFFFSFGPTGSDRPIILTFEAACHGHLFSPLIMSGLSPLLQSSPLPFIGWALFCLPRWSLVVRCGLPPRFFRLIVSLSPDRFYLLGLGVPEQPPLAGGLFFLVCSHLRFFFHDHLTSFLIIFSRSPIFDGCPILFRPPGGGLVMRVSFSYIRPNSYRFAFLARQTLVLPLLPPA